MNLQKLNYMIAIADEGSLSKAAEKLFITPSALSQYISREEELLGVPLFSRSREKWILTYAGEVYIDAARRLININDDTERLIQDLLHFAEQVILYRVDAADLHDIMRIDGTFRDLIARVKNVSIPDLET